jgi:hypothetical protein
LKTLEILEIACSIARQLEAPLGVPPLVTTPGVIVDLAEAAVLTARPEAAVLTALEYADKWVAPALLRAWSDAARGAPPELEVRLLNAARHVALTLQQSIGEEVE